MGDQGCNKGHGRGDAALIENAILLAGPTASGKSALALTLAERLGGVIVNTDSMQVYDGLRILSARPDAEAAARVPHRLYGHVPPEQAYSVGAWLADVVDLTRQGAFQNARPIFVGGTGLYFKALLEGLVVLPEIPLHIRNAWRDRVLREGSHTLHETLRGLDPEGAMLLSPSDGQRIVRALEVLAATGRPLRQWQAAPAVPAVASATATCLVLEPPREDLHQRIGHRFDAMVDEGAMAEAVAVARRVSDPMAPALKAIGVRELLAAQSGLIPLSDAILQAQVATRRYAKRQSTWFRTQFGPEWRRFSSAAEIHGFLSF